jgi:hypothetical protein
MSTIRDMMGKEFDTKGLDTLKVRAIMDRHIPHEVFGFMLDGEWKDTGIEHLAVYATKEEAKRVMALMSTDIALEKETVDVKDYR